ncbi:Hypothetical predicted protein [Paramuricea clavata]|uniref:Uncharacterized protein n=1 Tax=Paramuricea clavata TaxID=317549 RepID=A0A6S7JSK4_PARCT|nr:Hypothetical predicted protein [Paramuricea clavata]
MESCLKLLPNKSYNKYSLLFLTLFVLIGVVLIGIATDFHSKATLQCNPDKTLASDLSTRKYIETQCLLKYAQEFYPSLPLHNLFMINFGLVLLLNIIYAYSVKERVEIFADPPSTATNGGEEESRPLLGISRAASDPKACRNPGGHIIFTVYIMHLIFCRIVPLVVFATFLLTSSHFPVQYDCPWPKQVTSTSRGNFTQNQSMNFSTVDCTYLMGSNKEKLAATVVTIDLFFGVVAFMELAYLLWSTWKDRNLFIDLEFCCVYLLRKRKRIRKLMKKIRENISDEIFYLHDDFGEKRLSRRKLEEMYVNVIIQEGRESTCARWFEDRQEVYKIYFKAPADATTLTKMADLFKPTGACEKRPKTILVVGRPGIGKTLLTKKLLYQWQQQISKFWHNKIVILIRFRAFNKGQTSLRNMLSNSDGLNMALADLNYIYEYVCLIPSDVILIFDGLDELNLKVDRGFLANEYSINSPDQVSHIFQIFKELVKGTLLPGVTLLTTSRPTGERIYQALEFDREIEILGFHEEQIKDYVEKFCRHDIQKRSEIWNLIKESPELLSLCYIPVNSYIVCLTLKESIEVEGQSNVPRTITELYKRAIKILLFRHHLGYKDKPTPKNYITGKLPEPLQNDLNALNGIARNGMIEDQLIFEFENDDESASELSDCGLFNKLEDKRQNIFCFLHLTIQEFLAALHVVDDMENVEPFLSEHIKIPKWYLVIQFVAGLIGDKMRELKAQRNKLQRYACLVDQLNIL